MRYDTFCQQSSGWHLSTNCLYLQMEVWEHGRLIHVQQQYSRKEEYFLHHWTPKQTNSVWWIMWFLHAGKKQRAQDGVIFFATWTTLCFVSTISLPANKGHTIHGMMFILVLNDANNIHSSRKPSLYVYYSHTFPHLHMKIQTVGWQGFAARLSQYKLYLIHYSTWRACPMLF